MTGEDAIAWNLARLNTAFIHHYDRRECDEVLALFTPNAGHIVQVTDRYTVDDGRWTIASRVAEDLLAPATG